MASRMPKLAVQRVHTGDRTLDEAQRLAQRTAHTINIHPLLRGRLISVKFAVGGTYVVVSHGLGVPAACFPVRMNYDVGFAALGPTFAENPSQAGLDVNNQLSIVANNACTVDLWFYPRSSVTIPSGKTQGP